MYFFRWLTSRTVRKAAELEDAVRKLLNHQRDVLAPNAVSAVEGDLSDFRKLVRGGAEAEAIRARMDVLETIANKWLKPYPHQSLRDNLVMLLEIAVLIVGSRAFLIQPMVIPTGSAQPTLWGVTYEDLRNSPTAIPSWPVRLWEKAMYGVSYFEIVAPADLTLKGFQEKPKMFFPFVKRQYLYTSAGPIPVWFPPDDFPRQLGMLDESQRTWKQESFRRGEVMARARLITGDHLFVERISYNFRRPKRGEIIVFRSERHPGMTPNTHYIKRLVGLGGERIRIGDDRHSYINDRELTTNDFGFRDVFGFDPAVPPRPDHYSGHVNGTIWQQTTGFPGPTRNFPNGQTEVQIRPKHYVTFGDNTMNSADSRFWPEPDFPQERVIGQHWMVFWPFIRNGRRNIGMWQE
ncbi:MAG TPA: signal peptidase I [Verrucomicrobiota bacterium]|nr:signal peptidase I [Verrucomicrobiales bacterium]HRI13024.1 signal peptidase I [Verrucomicrobiota bacterium]